MIWKQILVVITYHFWCLMLFVNTETFTFLFLFLNQNLHYIYILRSQAVTRNTKNIKCSVWKDHFYLHTFQEGRKTTIKQIYCKQHVKMTGPKLTQITVCRDLQLHRKQLQMKTNCTAVSRHQGSSKTHPALIKRKMFLLKKKKKRYFKKASQHIKRPRKIWS